MEELSQCSPITQPPRDSRLACWLVGSSVHPSILLPSFIHPSIHLSLNELWTFLGCWAPFGEKMLSGNWLFNKKQWGWTMGPHTCNSNYLGGCNQEDFSLKRPAQANRFARLRLQNNQSKMDWGCGSSGTAPALRNPVFKPPVPQKRGGGARREDHSRMGSQYICACMKISQ
jgi:hypothetical protein